MKIRVFSKDRYLKWLDKNGKQKYKPFKWHEELDGYPVNTKTNEIIGTHYFSDREWEEEREVI